MNSQLPPVQIQPQPLPMQWLVGTVGSVDKQMIVLQILTPQGTTVFFMDTEDAISLGDQISEEARLASSGLTIAKELPKA